MKKLIFSLSLFSIGIPSSKATFNNTTSISDANDLILESSYDVDSEIIEYVEERIQSLESDIKILESDIDGEKITGKDVESLIGEDKSLSLFYGSIPDYNICDDFLSLNNHPLNSHFMEVDKEKTFSLHLSNLNFPFLFQTNEGKKNEYSKEELGQMGSSNLGFSPISPQLPVKGTFANDKNSNNNEISVKNHNQKKKKKPFKCNECDKSFASKSDLGRHKRIHTGEKPYQCKECNKRFTRKSGLNLHGATHKEEKPYQCRVCPKNFKLEAYLKKHEKNHTKGLAKSK